MKVIALCLAICLTPLCVSAEPKRDNLQTDPLLKASAVEISTLNLRQTESLAQAIVNCTVKVNAKSLPERCDQARRYFVIVGPRTGPLAALFDVWSVIKDSFELDPSSYFKDSPRVLSIETEWQKALRERFAVLDKDGRS